jgi:HTH-type transcriptional regulator / antitoxin HigA
MTEALAFEPAWFSPPGELIAEKLRRSGTSVEHFAWEMDVEETEAKRLMEGRLEITDQIASRLQTVVGGSTKFWIVREAQYRKDMSRVAQSLDKDVAKQWLRTLPIKQMKDFGWIEPNGNEVDILAECLRYFDVFSVRGFQTKLEQINSATKLRSSQAFKSNPASLAAWLRRGEIEADCIKTERWNRDRFRDLMPELRKLTRLRQPSKFVPMLQKACAEAGVAVVIVRAPSGCRASGATSFLSDEKAMLMLSFRYLRDDHFWFSFFHECGHLILHEKGQMFIEGEPHEQVAHEEEANQFAARTLIPDPWYRSLEKLPTTEKEVVRFAVRVGVSPGIVVGQLQHRGRISHGFLDYLKRKFDWKAEGVIHEKG